MAARTTHDANDADEDGCGVNEAPPQPMEHGSSEALPPPSSGRVPPRGAMHQVSALPEFDDETQVNA